MSRTGSSWSRNRRLLRLVRPYRLGAVASIVSLLIGVGANPGALNLDEEIRAGRFREDLFYRLNVINIHLPALRRRMEDIPILTAHFIKKYAPKRKDIVISDITDEAMHILLNYNFPGNVRELENIIEHSISFAGYPEILPSDLPHALIQSGLKRRIATPKMKDAVASFEKELIWSALQEARGNISRAAATLGIYRQQLQRKIKQLKIAT